MSSLGHPRPTLFPLARKGDSWEKGAGEGAREGRGKARATAPFPLPATCSLKRTRVGRECQPPKAPESKCRRLREHLSLASQKAPATYQKEKGEP